MTGGSRFLTRKKSKTVDTHKTTTVAAQKNVSAFDAAPQQESGVWTGQAWADRSLQMELFTNAQGMYGSTAADEAAPGLLPQQQKPVKEGFREKRNRKNLEKQQKEIAKAHRGEVRDEKGKLAAPAADAFSCRMAFALKEQKEQCDNSLPESALQTLHRAGVEAKIIRPFLQGYRKDEYGDALDIVEGMKRLSDESFIEDYCSNDLEQRRPHLQRIVRQLVATRITPDMLTEQYLSEHAAEIKQLCDQMTYLENMQKDPINAPFFEQMSEMEKTLLDTRVTSVCGPLSNWFVFACAKKGVHANSQYVRDEQPWFITSDDTYLQAYKHGVTMEDSAKQHLISVLEGNAQTEQSAFDAEYSLEGKRMRDTIYSAAAAYAPKLTGRADVEENAEKLKQECEKKGAGGLSIIEKSNASFAAKNADKVTKESGALQELTIRIDGEVTTLEKATRGSVFEPFYQDATDYLIGLESAGLPFEQMLAGSVKERVSDGSPAQSVTGGGVDLISDAIFGMMRPYLESDECMKAITASYGAYGGVDVFKNAPELFVSYWMQNVILRETRQVLGRYNVAMEGKYGRGKIPDSVTNLPNNAIRTVVAVSRASMNWSEEQIANMGKSKEGMQRSIRSFQEIVRAVTQKLPQKAPEPPQQPDQPPMATATTADSAADAS